MAKYRTWMLRNLSDVLYRSVDLLAVPDSSDSRTDISSWPCDKRYPSNQTVTVFRGILAEMIETWPVLVAGFLFTHIARSVRKTHTDARNFPPCL